MRLAATESLVPRQRVGYRIFDPLVCRLLACAERLLDEPPRVLHEWDDSLSAVPPALGIRRDHAGRDGGMSVLSRALRSANDVRRAGFRDAGVAWCPRGCRRSREALIRW